MPNLIGPGLNQVPNNGLLGGLAYQSPDNAHIKKLEIENIPGIDAIVEREPINVFIYDTSRDSDGGAWRYRTQSTSWYNEQLGTRSRGTRREFPSVVVIAVELDRMVIYDADDPNLPMWMSFSEPNTIGSHTYRKMMGQCSDPGERFPISAVNGSIFLGGMNPWHDGLTEINFITDRSKLFMGDGIRYGKYNIVDRNLAGCYTLGQNANLPQLVSNLAYDMNAEVLPGADTDPDTGLPIPTISFSSNSGVCFGDTYTDFYNISYTNFNAGGWAGFTFDKKCYVFTDSTYYASRFLRVYEKPTADISGGAYNSHDYALRSYCGDYVGYAYGYDLNFLWNNHRHWGNIYADNITTTDDGFSISQWTRQVVLIRENLNDPTNGMIYGIGDNCISGWMHGLIRGSWLAYADSALETKTFVSVGIYHVTTADRASNYTVQYSDDNTNWTTAFSGVIDSGASVGEKTGTNPGDGSYGAHRYWKYVEGTAVTGHHPRSSRIFLTDTDGVKHEIAAYYQDNSSDLGDYQIGTVYFDTYNIGATKDRSIALCGINANPGGNIEKSPVAPGADLVGWKFTSTSSYFTQVDANAGNNLIGNSIGSGNFCIMLWFKVPSNTGGPTFVDIAGAAVPRFFIGADYRDNRIWIYMNSSSGTVEFTPYQDLIANDTWQFIVVKRVGTTIYSSLNGNGWLTNTNNAWGGNINSTSNYVTIGQNYSHGAGVNHSLSLVRISQSNPSIDDIQKIYNDEKDLFLENAKCTLTAENVYATKFDKKRKILHVGTPAGRNDFQGIRRINNTTTPIGSTALYAYDGLIVER